MLLFPQAEIADALRLFWLTASTRPPDVFEGARAVASKAVVAPSRGRQKGETPGCNLLVAVQFLLEGAQSTLVTPWS